MATLRLTLFDSSFEVLDRIDLVIQGKEKHGAGQAIQAIKSFLWENHFSADLDPILATRQNLLAKCEALSLEVEKVSKMATSFLQGHRGGRSVPLELHDSMLADKIQDQMPMQITLRGLIERVAQIDLLSINAAIQEARMMNDLSLPEKYKKELEERFGCKKEET
jgi:hypothetical protein